MERPSCYSKKEFILEKLKDKRPPFKTKKSDFQLFNRSGHNCFIYENKFRMLN